MSRFAAVWRARPKPRCQVCHKWNHVYLTGGTFLTHCAYCQAALETRWPQAVWGAVAVGVGVLILAAALLLFAW